MSGRAREFDAVLCQDAVVKFWDASGAQQLSILIEARPVENNVVRLPLARRARGVNQRRILAVNRSRLAICIRFVFVRIQDLNLIDTHQKDATVATLLTLAFGRSGFCELDVQLAIT